MMMRMRWMNTLYNDWTHCTLPHTPLLRGGDDNEHMKLDIQEHWTEGYHIKVTHLMMSLCRKDTTYPWSNRLRSPSKLSGPNDDAAHDDDDDEA